MTLEEKIDEVLRILKAWPTTGGAAPTGKRWDGPGATATDAEMDGQYGNPAVYKTEPKEWDLGSQVGVKASDVPPAYGHLYAAMMDRFGDKAKREGTLDKSGKPNAWRQYQTAAMFRGWAKRNAGKTEDLF